VHQIKEADVKSNIQTAILTDTFLLVTSGKQPRWTEITCSHGKANITSIKHNMQYKDTKLN